MAILLKAIYRFNVMPIRIPILFFTEIEKSIINFIWNHKKSGIIRKILIENSNNRGIIILDSKLYYRALVTNIPWNKNRTP
jgi:hypothetical protein